MLNRVILALTLTLSSSLAPMAVLQSRYDVSREGDVVTLSDTRATIVVRVLTTASNAYLRPTGVLQGRLVKIGGQLDF